MCWPFVDLSLEESRRKKRRWRYWFGWVSQVISVFLHLTLAPAFLLRLPIFLHPPTHLPTPQTLKRNSSKLSSESRLKSPSRDSFSLVHFLRFKMTFQYDWRHQYPYDTRPNPQPFDNRLHTHWLAPSPDSVYAQHPSYVACTTEHFRPPESRYAHPSSHQYPAHNPYPYQYPYWGYGYGSTPSYDYRPTYGPTYGQPSQNDPNNRAPYHHWSVGRTKEQVDYDNAMMAQRCGANDKKAIRPADFSESTKYWVHDNKGNNFLEFGENIEATYKGEWKQEPGGRIVFYQAE